MSLNKIIAVLLLYGVFTPLSAISMPMNALLSSGKIGITPIAPFIVVNNTADALSIQAILLEFWTAGSCSGSNSSSVISSGGNLTANTQTYHFSAELLHHIWPGSLTYNSLNITFQTIAGPTASQCLPIICDSTSCTCPTCPSPATFTFS